MKAHLLLLFVVLALPLPGFAQQTASVKCGVHEERVWVYASLATFDLATKLKCGETVQILGKANGYARIRTLGGKEGFVAEENLPQAASETVNQPQPAAAAPPLQRAPVSEPAHVAVAPTPVANVAPAPGMAPATVPRVETAPATALTPQPKPVSELTTPPASSSNSGALAPEHSPAKVLSEPKRADTISNIAPSPASGTTKPAELAPKSGEITDIDREEAHPAPACQLYFAAYDATRDQVAWFAKNTEKRFPGLCPAPTASVVDFVIIFGHDLNSFVSLLPMKTRTDSSGFSDWVPIVTSAKMRPVAESIKAHREYVWVFHTPRGAFNPAKFSPKAGPGFSKAESNSSVSFHADERTVEDALQFIRQSPIH